MPTYRALVLWVVHKVSSDVKPHHRRVFVVKILVPQWGSSGVRSVMRWKARPVGMVLPGEEHEGAELTGSAPFSRPEDIPGL